MVYFYCMSESSAIEKYIETKVQTICFYFTQSFFKEKSGLSFFSNHFPTLLKKSKQELKYVKNVKRILGEVKSICSHFQGAISYQKLPQT